MRKHIDCRAYPSAMHCTVALAAEVFCDDGRQFQGRIFLPASASAHTGVMRAE